MRLQRHRDAAFCLRGFVDGSGDSGEGGGSEGDVHAHGEAQPELRRGDVGVARAPDFFAQRAGAGGAERRKLAARDGGAFERKAKCAFGELLHILPEY